MRKLGIFLLILTVGLIFVSCTIPIDWFNDENEDIIIKTFLNGNLQQIEFLAYQDGKDGSWEKLDSTTGIYTFKPEADDGNYSIYAVNEIQNNEPMYEIKIMNFNTSELSEIPINFYTYASTSPEATLMLNFNNDFLEKWTGAYWGKCHGFYDFDDPAYLTNNEVYGVMPGTNDLVILLGDLINRGNYWSRDFINKIFIERGFTISEGEQELDLLLNEFVDIETFVATSTIADAYIESNLLVGGTTNVFNWELPEDHFIKLPASLKTDKDLYILSLVNNDYSNNISRLFKIYKSNPNDYEIINVFPADNWEKPTFANNTFYWTPYDPNITGHRMRFYEASLNNDDYTINWTFLFSNGWLGEADSYEYELPKLNNLGGWNDLWYPQEPIDSYQFFDAVAGNNNNLIRYLYEPIAGLEKSIFSYGINSSL
jgi:hypothetical protein